MQTTFTPEQLTDPGIQRANEILRTCVHCGFCTATCPTYQVLGDELDSPRGRIYLIKDMLENERKPDEKTVMHIDRCLSCLACMTTCPSGVHYMHLVDHARAYIEKNYDRPWSDRALRWMLARILPYPMRFRVALLGAKIGRPFARFMPDPRLTAMLEMAPKTIPPVSRNDEGAGCCGALTHHMGIEDESLATAAKNITACVKEIDAGGLDAIVINTSGCGTTVKDYGHMFRNDPLAADAERVSAIAMDVSEVLMKLDLPEGEDKGTKVAYHAACSLQHGQQIKTFPKDLLKKTGFTVLEPKDSHLCCGSAGTYNLMQPKISKQLKERKVETLEALTPDIIAAGNIGCMMQIGGGTDVPIVHTVELLDWATGGPQPPALTAPGKREPAIPMLR